MTTAIAPVGTGVGIEALSQSYLLACKARNLSAQTMSIYRYNLDRLADWLRSQGMPTDVGAVRREHLEAYLIDMQERGLKPASVSMAYRVMRTFFNWCVAEDEVAVSPMRKMRAPTVPVDPPAVIRDDQMKAILKTCDGKGFEDRRDRAILLTLYDTGMRRGELVNIDTEHLDLALGTVLVKGKARKFRAVAIGADAAHALDRYLRARAGHPRAKDPALFLGTKGRLGPSGVLQMVKKRGSQAGIVNLHAHLFRHTFAHNMLAGGATEGAVMALGGWQSRDLLDRYGASARSERAIEEHRRLSPADRLKRR